MSALADRILAEIRQETARQTVPAHFPALPEIPGSRYTRRDFFDLEIAHVLRKSWLMTGHIEDLPSRGSYKTFTKIPGAPILIVRGHDNEIRAFYNTCRHRGAPVAKDRAGQCNVLRCQYHSWAYDFAGRLVQVPDEHEFVGLDKAARGLIPVRCETFHGLIFVNEDANAISLREWMGPLATEWSAMNLENLKVDYRWSHIVNCNWKCAVDAFQEVYHINTLHPDTVGAQLDRTAAAMGLLPGGHSRMCVRLTAAEICDQPPGGWPEGELYRRTSVAQTLWPALIVPWQIVGGKFILFWPRTVNQCEIEVLGLGPSWGEGELPHDRQMANAAFDGILMEDMENLEGIQASLESDAFTGMMIGYQERRIYWFHEQIDRAIGTERLPSELAVRQRLEPFVERSAQADKPRN